MSNLLELPAGHPQGGFVTDDPSPILGVGVRPAEEVEQAAERDASYQADVEAVAQAEHETALAIQEARLDTSGLRVSSLIPNYCSISGKELVLLHVYGSGFDPSTQIWWHDHFEPTEFVSDRELTTWVTPWLFLVPDIIDVGVGTAGTPPADEDDEGTPGTEGDRKLNFWLVP